MVKVEIPGADIAQTYGKVVRGRSGLYSQLNAGKRSVLLDLRQPGDVARLLDLAAACDVVIENFRPGILDGYGAGWAELSAVNPRLVMLSISGFGQDGPEASRPAYAPVIHAEAGLIGRQAEVSGQPPADLALALADSLAGLHGTIAVLAALRLREATGTGQHIDLSMLEAMLATDDYTHYAIEDHPVWPARGEAWDAPGGPLLVASDRRHLWRQLKTHFGLADPDPDAPLAAKLEARAQTIAAWIAGHEERDEAQARSGAGRPGLGGDPPRQRGAGPPGRRGPRHDRRGGRGWRRAAFGRAHAIPVQRRRRGPAPRRAGDRRAHPRCARRVDRVGGVHGA